MRNVDGTHMIMLQGHVDHHLCGVSNPRTIGLSLAFLAPGAAAAPLPGLSFGAVRLIMAAVPFGVSLSRPPSTPPQPRHCCRADAAHDTNHLRVTDSLSRPRISCLTYGVTLDTAFSFESRNGQGNGRTHSSSCGQKQDALLLSCRSFN